MIGIFSRSSTNSEKIQKAMDDSMATLNAEQKAFFDILSNHLGITIVSKYSTEQKQNIKGYCFRGEVLVWCNI